MNQLFKNFIDRVSRHKELKTRREVADHLKSCIHDVDDIYEPICIKHLSFDAAKGRCDGMRRAWNDSISWLSDESIDLLSLKTRIDEYTKKSLEQRLDIPLNELGSNPDSVITKHYMEEYYPSAASAYGCVSRDLEPLLANVQQQARMM